MQRREGEGVYWVTTLHEGRKTNAPEEHRLGALRVHRKPHLNRIYFRTGSRFNTASKALSSLAHLAAQSFDPRKATVAPVPEATVSR